MHGWPRFNCDLQLILWVNSIHIEISWSKKLIWNCIKRMQPGLRNPSSSSFSLNNKEIFSTLWQQMYFPGPKTRSSKNSLIIGVAHFFLLMQIMKDFLAALILADVTRQFPIWGFKNTAKPCCARVAKLVAITSVDNPTLFIWTNYEIAWQYRTSWLQHLGKLLCDIKFYQ